MATEDVQAPGKGRKAVTAITIEAWAKSGLAKHWLDEGGPARGLYLQTDSKGGASWVLRYRFNAATRWPGLGSYDKAGKHGLTLAQARDKATKWRALIREGRDPLAERQAAKAEVVEKAAEAKAVAEVETRTFQLVAEQYIAAHERGWRNRKHALQWSATLTAYVFPHFGRVPVADVATDHVLAALQPIWQSKPETAGRVRGRIEVILDSAKVRGWRSGENPARWRGHLSHLLPAKTKIAKVRHHAALAWKEAPAFMRFAAEQRGTSWGALRVALLTAARSGEIRGATWAEINLDEAVWTVPGTRMKAARVHRVPLSEPALAILHQLRGDSAPAPAALVFPAANGGVLSDMSLTMALRRSPWRDAGARTLTAHGMRSCLRTWIAEATGYSHELAEAALAHTIGDKVVAAYQHGDMFEKRRRLMADWAAFVCCPAEPGSSVVPLHATANAA